MLIYVLFAMSTPLILSNSFPSFDNQLATFEARIKYYFFLTNDKPLPLFANATIENDTSINGSVTSPKSGCPALTSLFFICFTFRSVMGFFTDAFVLVTALSLWHPVIDFAMSLKNVCKNDQPLDSKGFNCALKEYKELKELSNVINDAVQTVVFTFVIQAIFFYSTRLKEWITNTGPGTLYLSFFFVSFFLMFYFAADICKQV